LRKAETARCVIKDVVLLESLSTIRELDFPLKKFIWSAVRFKFHRNLFFYCLETKESGNLTNLDNAYSLNR